MSYGDFGAYENGGGYDGGGYNDGGGGGGGGFNRNGGSSSGTPDKKGGREQSVQTMTPVTVKMLFDANLNPQDDSLTIDTKQVLKVVLVGRIVSVESREAFTKYLVDDGTGTVSVSKLKSDEGVQSATDYIPEGTYVSVHGKATSTQDGGGGQQTREINCHHIRIITDHNEVTAHFLSTIFNHYQNLKGPLNDGSKLGAASAAGGNFANGNFGGGGSGFGGGGAGGGFNQPQMDSGMGGGVDMDSRRVHDAFASDQGSDAGLSVQQVADELKKYGFNIQKVRSICQVLMMDGLLYSTIDDDHFKSTGSVL